MGNRRKGREQALQILCLLDAQPDLSVEQGLSLFYRDLFGRDLFGREPAPQDAAPPDTLEGEDEAPDAAEAEREELRRFTEGLVRGVRHSLGEIDILLGKSSRNWRLERMAWVDRNLLRLAAYELRHSDNVPAKVAINEAIELAKRFGTAESPSFVNGVLDRVMEDLGRR